LFVVRLGVTDTPDQFNVAVPLDRVTVVNAYVASEVVRPPVQVVVDQVGPPELI
jgi:hypothetical protein